VLPVAPRARWSGRPKDGRAGARSLDGYRRHSAAHMRRFVQEGEPQRREPAITDDRP
jgi:hypothetical protein